MAEGYDPKRSRVSDDTMQLWRVSPVNGDLSEVPGIGPAAIKKLAEADPPITNTYQLFGKFLMLKGPDSDERKVTCLEHTERFWYYLKQRGITAHRSAIVKAIAEKAATFFAGIYDETEWDDEDDDEDDE